MPNRFRQMFMPQNPLEQIQQQQSQIGKIGGGGSPGGSAGGVVLGGATGAMGGASTGAALGSMIMPGVGTAIGGVLGALLGGASGGKAGYDSGKIEVPDLSGFGKIKNADGSQGIGSLIASLSRKKKLSGGGANTANIA